MHPYQVDEPIRTRVFLAAAIVAVIAARLLALALERLAVQPFWWLDTPSVLGFFGIFVGLFDRYLWKTKPFQIWEWFRIPNLNGVWQAEVKSSHTGFDQPITARVVIRQTASKMCVAMETDGSSSHSINASLLRTDRLHPYELTYNYINKPKAHSVTTMSIHQGTAWLDICDDGQTLDGEYYTGRGRQNFGRLVLRRQAVP